MKKIVLLTLSCVVGGLMIVLSLNAYAQTPNTVLLDEQNHYGQFSIDNVRVFEKDYYKVVSMNVHVKVKDLALEDSSNVYWYSITLTNENGKKYQAEGGVDADCNKKGWDGTFYEVQMVSGSEGGIGQHSLCYMVEKEFNNFKVYYTSPLNNPNNPFPVFQIGSIDLTQDTNDQVQTLSQNPSNSSQSSPSNFSSPSTSQSQTDIFEQLIDMIKNLFHFS